MVLNVTDEVINGAPKYNITPNGDGTNSIELANEVVSEGTPLNRNLFNIIENVLSYQIPSVEQRSTKPDYFGNILPVDISPTWSASGTNIGNTILCNLTSFNGITPTMTFVAGNGNDFKASSSSSNGYYAYSQRTSASTKYYTSEKLLEDLQKTATDTYKKSFIRYSGTAGGKNGNTIIIIDMKEICIPRFNFNCLASDDGYNKLWVSNDGENWIDKETLHNNTIIELDIPYRYYKFEDGFNFGYLFIDKVKFGKSNIFTLGNRTTFNYNERILLNTSNEVVVSGVSGNTFNGVEIDTILEANKYYELVYNQSQNKFIAQEVLN